jgi:hypothetical protein
MSEYSDRVSAHLQSAADTYRERNAVYKDNFRAVGRVMEALFPNGQTIHSREEFDRWHLFELVIVKLTRYVSNFNDGGHEDSIIDMIPYLAMINALDKEAAETADDEPEGNMGPMSYEEAKEFARRLGLYILPEDAKRSAEPDKEPDKEPEEEDDLDELLEDDEDDEDEMDFDDEPDEPPAVFAATFGPKTFNIGEEVHFKQHLNKGKTATVSGFRNGSDHGLDLQITMDNGEMTWVHPSWMYPVGEKSPEEQMLSDMGVTGFTDRVASDDTFKCMVCGSDLRNCGHH